MRITIPLVYPGQNVGPLRVAVVPRLVPALSYGLAVAGAGVGAMLLRRVLLALQSAEAAGISAVSGGMAEANVSVLVGLYLAIVGGVAGLLILVVRMFVETKTASPSFRFFLVAGILGLIPAAVLWWAESLFIGTLYPDSGGIVTVAETLTFALTAVMIGAPFIMLTLVAIAVWPVRSATKPKWAPIAGLLIVEVALIVLAVAFQMRTSWLMQVSHAEQLLP